MKTQHATATVEQLKLMLASATATLELLQKQLESANAVVDSLSVAPSKIVAADSPEQKTTRDTSRWELDGEDYPKGRFLLAVFKSRVAGKMDMKEVESFFDADKVFAGQAVVGNRTLYQLAHEVKDETRFHKDEEITTRDGKVLVVSNQFGIKNFPALLRYLSRHLGIPLKMKGEDPYSDRWKELLKE